MTRVERPFVADPSDSNGGCNVRDRLMQMCHKARRLEKSFGYGVQTGLRQRLRFVLAAIEHDNCVIMIVFRLAHAKRAFALNPVAGINLWKKGIAIRLGVHTS